MSGQDSENETKYSRVIGTRLTPSTKARFDEYQERHQLNDSEALRRLVRAQLEPSNSSLTAVALVSAVLYIIAMSPPVESPQWGAIIGGTMIGYTVVWSQLGALREVASMIRDIVIR